MINDQFTCQITIDVKANTWRQKICDAVLVALRKIDPDRGYSTIEMRSSPDIEPQVKQECLRKGYELAHELFADEVRVKKIEELGAVLQPNLWRSVTVQR
jgi:hypothetical protein